MSERDWYKAHLLPDVPSDVLVVGEGSRSPPDGRPKWSGITPPPPMGKSIQITLNGWEGYRGTVVGYRTDGFDGDLWLSVLVRMDDRPDWHRRSNPDRDVCLFVGCEVRDVQA